MIEDGYTFVLNAYVQSVFQDFESDLRTKRVSEENFELILRQYNQNFFIYKISPCFNSNKDVSDAVKTFGYQIKDDIRKKTNWLTDKILGFDNISFFNVFSGFNPSRV